MKILAFTLFMFTFLNLNAQNIEKMSGDVFIDLEKGKISQNILVVNVLNTSDNPVFLLHKYLVIDSVLVNGQRVNFKKDTSRTYYMSNFYSLLPVSGLVAHDSLRFFLSGEFQVVNDTSAKYTFRSDHDMIESFSIFRANGLSAWHPVMLEANDIPVSEMMKMKKINYSLRLSCNEGKKIYAGTGKQPETHYQLLGIQNLPVIIAGEFSFDKVGNSILINIDSAERKILTDESKKIIRYYEELTGVPFIADPVFAKVEMDFGSEKEFAFYSYPATVFVNKRGHTKVGTNMMVSHELAHYYFGNVYVPGTNLYWFFSESITEYFSLKYHISHKNYSVPAEKYQTLKMLKQKTRSPFRRNINGYDCHFVRLNRVKAIHEIHEIQRYFYSPFQLLGMEHEIGEANMMAFIKNVYPELGNTGNGYAAIVNTLHNIGIDRKIIKRIEHKYFKRLSLRDYRFLESVL